ncbi:MAG TPA: c-type cytochrome [Steroidobacteraceae bacterium]|nr:c-type cytochrome [Steroidobacteraceae bacterium]
MKISRAGVILVLGTLAALQISQAGAPEDWTKVSPTDAVKNTPKGGLHNPYKDSQSDIVAQGESLFRSYSCSGCHGGTGGGGMCPAVTNDTWVYGGDDDTLFRLVTLGTADLQKAGYTRTGRENVVGPMPPMGTIIKNADDLWKIIAFIRAHYDGDPTYKFGAPASQ